MAVTSAYRSEIAQKKALASYDNFLAEWPVPYLEKLIETSFGETHVLISGSKEFKPLVLLHGGGGNSTMWLHNIAGLAGHFQVYAIDIIGEAGKSAATRPSYKSDGHSRWLKEVFDALGINEVVLCGASLGGVLAHKFALAFSSRITALISLAPPSILRMRPSFLFRAILANAIPTAFFAKKFLHYISANAPNFPDSAIEAFVTQVKAYKPNMEAIPVITDAELSQLPPKTLLLLGQEEVIYDANQAAERVRRAAPAVTVKIVPGAKHILSADQPELFNKVLIEFVY